MANTLSSTKEPASGEGKQVTFNPNPVTIPAGSAASATGRDKTTDALSNGSTGAEPLSSIKGTIPITDMTDPTKVKNVLVSSVVPLPVGGDHTYAKTTPTGDEGDDSSSSSDSSSESDTDTDPEKPTDDSGPGSAIISTNGTPLTVNPPSALISPVDTPTTTPKKRGRPRKNVATPQSVPPPKKTKANTKSGEPPLRSILKLGSSAPTTPVSKSSDSTASNAKKNIRRRGRGCGSCVGCVREDCGKCLYCLDKPKYGGPGRKKQRCALRSCSQFVSVGKRLPACYMNKMPDTPKTAAILTVAQHLVAAAAANNDNQSIPLATPIQASEPSPVQQETPIIKLTDGTFIDKAAGMAPDGDSLASLILASTDTVPLSGSSLSKVPPVSDETAGLSSFLASTSTPAKMKPLDPDSMKCVVCTRERKIKLAKTDKFCTLRCMKAWLEQNPGKNPDTAEPGETKNLLCMPPTTAIADQPRAIKKLLIDMALPGAQPFFASSLSPPKSVNIPPGAPPAATSTSSILTNASMLTPIGTPSGSSVASPAAPTASVGGVKRQPPADDTNQSVKKYKETSLTLTSSTKTIPTTSVAKTTSIKSGAPASNRRRGPNDLPVDVSKWSIGDVKKFFESKPDCQPVLSLLEDQEIDGQALLLLSQDTMVKCLNIKLGPALKIMAHVDQLKQQQATHT
ncbi:PREDICTED: uncharacterized protein LOC105313871 isoform X2 [Amphimedon queenslandica]|uniref:CXXC-type domain-containing protein n=1 Tax=Amphimedon queenslandica TaxID=400682 RepID=A0A1X7U784_AMPQE|nr:PREDICTED: uncharacterized protein LOC105313871 isoform X2 [Amphimedon queenslandica]|eukprot:XP_011405944.2 PREDICTED: uncharacterized protein LOC105313871 isoform X2 [Amphimedon queenslandica]